MLILAYFVVFGIGVSFCFWASWHFYKKCSVFKAITSSILAILAIGGLVQAIKGV